MRKKRTEKETVEKACRLAPVENKECGFETRNACAQMTVIAPRDFHRGRRGGGSGGALFFINVEVSARWNRVTLWFAHAVLPLTTRTH